MTTQKTKVHFRRWPDGSVIALFPEDTGWETSMIGSYEHVGQHGAAHPDLIAMLGVAIPTEYASLKAELEGDPYGYKLEVLP